MANQHAAYSAHAHTYTPPSDVNSVLKSRYGSREGQSAFRASRFAFNFVGVVGSAQHVEREPKHLHAPEKADLDLVANIWTCFL